MRTTLLILLMAISFLSCKNKKGKEVFIKEQSRYETYDLDKTNAGEIMLFADKNTSTLLDQLGTVFKSHFPQASLNVVYKEEAEVMDALYRDSVRLVVLLRESSVNEINRLKQIYESDPIQHTFAYDAVALVRDAASTDTLIDKLQLNQWIREKEELFVTTSDYIGIYQHFLRTNGVLEGIRNINVVKNLNELQKYLKEHPSHIGVLPFSLVSNQNNPESKDIASGFRWVGIKHGKEEIFPSQSTIFTREWPMILPYTIMYCRLPSRKGVGFVKFVHNRQSAKLILKAGLIPYTMPQRQIQIEDQSFNL